MSPGPNEGAHTTSEETGFVSARFLSDFFSALSRRGIAATELVGDLPIFIDERGRVTRVVEWRHFADFLRRLEIEVEGAEGLEQLGEMICEMKPARTIQSLAGLAASPYSLYRAASRWALRRAIPGVESSIEREGATDLLIRARFADSLRACPQLFHIATGGARALPRILGMPDAVVNPTINEREAIFQITIPPSRTFSARIRRFCQVLFSAGSVLRLLEDQQLELHAKHDALMRAHAELEENEKRIRQMNDAAVDVLCEIDEQGHVSYISAAVYELLGYTPEQVIGSHFRLWIPKKYHAVVSDGFQQLFTEPAGQSSIRDRITLHAAGGRRTAVELMARTYFLSERSSEDPAASATTRDRGPTPGKAGAWRFVVTLRPLRDPPESRAFGQLPANTLPQAAPSFDQSVDSFDAAALSSAAALLTDAGLPEHLERAVEDSLFAAPDGLDASDWMDTRKLADRAQFALQSESSVALRTDLRNAPAEIAGDEELLVACLRGLLGWGVARLGAKTTPHAFARSTSPKTLCLRIEKAANSGVRLSVGIDSPRVGSREKNCERRPAESTGDRPTDLMLCLTQAQDAALALGGRLKAQEDRPQSVSPRTSNETSPLDLALDPYATKQMVEIPQPGQPETRR